MRLKGLDLNLLVALDALLATQSVSRAAERLHLSQPAVSAALGRLRTFFSDPILVSHGKRMIPTPFASRLKPLLAQVISDVDAMVSVSPHFDPAVSTRWFRIGASDYLTKVVFAGLLQRFARTAPGICIELIPPNDSIQQMLEAGELDLLLVPADHVSIRHPSQLLFEERHVVAGWSGNPVFKGTMTREAFDAAGHVAVEIGRIARASFAEMQLRMRGIERRIEVMASSFTVVPELLVETTRLAVMHERLAISASRHLPIAHAELPFEFPLMHEMLQYHHARGDDPGLQWLIAEIQASTA